ncbi:MAG TPA: GNAT family N-acetyltransferase [Dokdonella sp.]|nr:GNAT family N-acetyltransferase [Dokdonella sp.]
MSYVEVPEMLELIPIDIPNLRRLAASEPVDLGGIEVLDGALPPARVAAHALAQLDAGTSAHWCTPFLIVSRSAVLGSCRFRNAPARGSVEIGYEVAESQRGQGVATAAVRQLLLKATSSGLVQQVVAHILPGNVASSRVVSRLGFSEGDLIVDHDGETVALWSIQVAT